MTLGIGIYTVFILDTSMDEALLSAGERGLTTRLYFFDENGGAVELSSDRISGYENAIFCPLEEMTPHLINAFIAIEDKRFWGHGGVDFARTFSAVLQYAGRGKADFGGSTITQQLVKNLTGDTERSIRRKAAEMIRAVKLEKRLTKHEILEEYLNVVNLAEGCYGVKSAANAYFSKEPAELLVEEAASIAAITQNPVRYDPVRSPEENKRRRDVILFEMHSQGMISDEEFEKAKAKELVLNVNNSAFSGRVNSWYADLVVNDVIAALMKEKGMSRAAAGRTVYCGGLKIYTAMDPALQEIVTEFYQNPENFPTHKNGKKAQSAFILLNPKNGDILAVAGAVGEKGSNRIQNFATDAKRPSGSVIKPLSVYAPALSRGLINYATVFDDVPHTFRKNGAPWPRNSPQLYRGLTTVNTALTHSLNTVSISVFERLGAAASFRFLTQELCFTSLDKRNDCGAVSLALGQQHEGVTLREIVAGYTPLAGNGNFCGARSFYRVLDKNDQEILSCSNKTKKVMERADSAILTMMLRSAVGEGTGAALTLKSVVDTAGKTGTTSKNSDKWFVGYTPELLAGVWYGFEYPEPLSDVKGNPALSVFDSVMHSVIEKRGVRVRQFETPDDVVTVRFCKDSGMLPGDACKYDPRGDRFEVGYFKKGTEPTAKCTCHIAVSYCAAGGVATAHCPCEGCHTTALLRVTRTFPRQIQVLDAPYTYGGAVPNKGLEFSYNEPYYAVNYSSKQNFGIGMNITPYNHACTAHSAAPFWQRRAVL